MMKLSLLLFLIFSFFCQPLFSTVCDNQFFPFFPRYHFRFEEKPSSIAVDGFFTTANKAYNDLENEVEIPELFGKYDENKLGLALTLVGKTNPLPAEFRGSKLLWLLRGKIESQGVAFAYEQSLFNHVAVGFSFLFMHVHARHEFSFLRGESSFPSTAEGDFNIVKEARLLMHKELGLCEAQSSRSGVGDFDCYLRYGGVWDYTWKCRKIQAGLTLGALMPSGKSRDINSPASVPFGGNGHWGIYVAGDAEFELKEDMKFGLAIRVSKRFRRTMNQRLAVAKEHPLYGALVAPVSVNPGSTFMFFPYIALENLREGLGMRLGLNLRHHSEDGFRDLRCAAQRHNLSVHTCKQQKPSHWKSDYASVNIFYDFGKMAVERGYKPIVTFTWDIPFLTFISSNIVKSHRVSLGVEVNF